MIPFMFPFNLRNAFDLVDIQQVLCINKLVVTIVCFCSLKNSWYSLISFKTLYYYTFVGLQ